jgi:hypothetical protein
MGARLWTALLMLAAVFSMHGLQCTAGDSAVEHVSTPLGAAASVGAPAAAIHVGTVAAAISDPWRVAATHGARDAASTGSTGLPAPQAPQAPGHDAHVWAVCLAVLLAGLTILGAVALLRGMAVPLIRGSPTPSRWLTGWSRQPRPPDLSVLCLLRI